jgi:hypothetical protein
LDAENAQNAVQHLLKVLCDAVVRVKASGNVVKPTLHFRHLLRAGLHIDLEETTFGRHLASDSDRMAFEKAISFAADGYVAGTAIHVHLSRCSGPPIPVQLILASLPDPDGPPGYLIGIRETKDVKEDEEESPAAPHRSPMRGDAEAQQKSKSKRCTSASSSASSESLQKVAFPQLASLVMYFDCDEDGFPICGCDMRFADGVDQQDMLLLEQLVHPSQWGCFFQYVQTWVNSKANDMDLPTFGPLVLSVPTHSGDVLHVVSQGVDLHETDCADDEDHLIQEGEPRIEGCESQNCDRSGNSFASEVRSAIEGEFKLGKRSVASESGSDDVSDISKRNYSLKLQLEECNHIFSRYRLGLRSILPALFPIPETQ